MNEELYKSELLPRNLYRKTLYQWKSDRQLLPNVFGHDLWKLLSRYTNNSSSLLR